MRWLGIGNPQLVKRSTSLRDPNSRGVDSSQTSTPRRVSIALGGGGARGLAHLGVMQSIAESNFQIDRIVGVSIGALAGAMCACGEDIAEVQARTIQWVNSPEFASRQTELSSTSGENDEPVTRTPSWYVRLKRFWADQRKLTRAVTSPSLLPEDALCNAIEALLPDCDLRDLEIPLSVVAIDLRSGRRVTLESGSLRKAVLASTSIPGIFPPVRWGNRLLADIGQIESIPIAIAKSYARDLTIGVDVGQTITPIKRCDTALDVMMRMDDISERIMRRHLTTKADRMIRPDVGHITWFDFRNPQRLIELGRVAAKGAIESIDCGRAA